MLQALFRPKRKEEAPEWVQEYWELNFRHPQDTPLEEVPFCSLDCETTGLERNSEVISIGAVKVHQRRIRICDAIDLRFAVSKGHKQSEIHEELAQESLIDNEVQLKKLLQYIGNSVIIGHHIAFDIAKVNQLIAGYAKGFSLKNKTSDTFLLMKRIDPMRFERKVGGLKSIQLGALCREFNIDIENRHTALGDAYLAAQLFIKQLNTLKRRKVVRFGDL
jgi:DNA polymerase-3 subunit epsilon